MSRFDKWAGAQMCGPEAVGAVAPRAPREEESFTVDNSQLKTRERGILFRNSQFLNDMDTRYADFGTTVSGVLSDDGQWLSIGKKFLPVSIDGHEVLEPQVWIPRKEDPSVARLPEFLRCHMTGEKPQPGGPWGDQVAPRLGRPPDAPMPGSGELHVVVAKQALVRQTPSAKGLIENTKQAGDVVELFDWDDTKEWRRYVDDQIAPGSLVVGWMKLYHADHGQLLRPLDFVGAAAALNNVAELRQLAARASRAELASEAYRDAFLLAVDKEHFDCVIVLLAHGVTTAAVQQTFSDEPSRWDKKGRKAIRALVAALTGEDFDISDFDLALDLSSPAFKELAERTLEATAERQKAVRNGSDVQAHTETGYRCTNCARELRSDENFCPKCGTPKIVNTPSKSVSASTTWREAHSAAVVNVVPEPMGPPRRFKVAYKTLAVREGPDLSSNGIGFLRKGVEVDLYDAEEKNGSMWAKCQVPESKEWGWVALEFPEAALQHLSGPFVPADSTAALVGDADQVPEKIDSEGQPQRSRAMDEWNLIRGDR